MTAVYITRWPSKGILKAALAVDPDGWAIYEGRALKRNRDFFDSHLAAYHNICERAERQLLTAQRSVQKSEALLARLHETGGIIPQGENQ